MKTKALLVALAFCLCAIASFAENPNVGTWKINASKSKIAAGAPMNDTVVYTMEGDNYKCVIDGKDGSGNPAHNEWTGKFDGKDYPVTGDAMSDTRALKMTDDHHYKLTSKKGGKVTITGNIVVSPDGKTRTVTTTSTNAEGKKMTATTVYDKQ
jgi:hypothetical protein